MKAITLWQPWASLMAWGLKENETRLWPAPRTLRPGDLVAIHAAKQADTKGFEMMSPYHSDMAAEAFAQVGVDLATPLPTGKVVCVSLFCKCWPAENTVFDLGSYERHFGDYSEGRWIWRMPVIYRITEPIPARGRQGLWNWNEPDWLRDFDEELYVRACAEDDWETEMREGRARL